MSVASILTALHYKALKEADPQSKGCRINNSAIEGEGKDAKVSSAGEHIISVFKDSTGDKGGKLKKDDAVSMLKSYVQWFVGPDLAGKVNNSTVVPLEQAPGSAQPAKNESTMSFKQYLEMIGESVEAGDIDHADEASDADYASEEDDIDYADEVDDTDEAPGEADDADESPEEADDADDAPEGDETKPEADTSKETETGYYIAYNLVVEGLPQRALKDAMKNLASTLFDGMTFSGSGLFGGSWSTTVKDIKD